MSEDSSLSRTVSGDGSTTNIMITRVDLNDYDMWRKGFDGFEGRRATAGIRNPRVYRNVNDGNQLVIVFDVDDPEQARAFFANPEVQKVMREGGGVRSLPVINFV
jgi:hypothetical protein